MSAPLTWLALDGVKKTDGTPLASGRLFFYVPGTTTQAAVYTDETGASVLSQPVVTDSYGRATVYVNGVVKVVAQDSDGATVATIERGTALSAKQVEVENAGFTGTTAAGSQAGGGKTTLDAALSSALASFGGKDFNFLDSAAGTERAMRIVVNERGLSVKSRGAKGDGSNVDTAAFVSSIGILAAAGGGILYVPPGTYVIDDVLNITASGIIVEGSGPNTSTIKQSHATASIFSVGAVEGHIRNLGLTYSGWVATGGSYAAAVANTGNGAIYTKGAQHSLHRLRIEGFDKGIHVYAGAYWNTISECAVFATGTTKHCIFNVGTANYHTRVLNNYFDKQTDVAGGIGVEISGATNVSNVLVSGNLFGTLTKGVVLGSTLIGSDYRIADNYLAECTTAIEAGAAAARLFLQYAGRGNRFGTAIISDASSYDAASATKLPIVGEGYYNVTGATQIDLIEKLGMPIGGVIRLKFASNPVVRHNQAAAGTGAPILLSGAGNFSSSADDTLTLMFDGTNFREQSRTVI